MTTEKTKRETDAARHNLTKTMQIEKDIPIPENTFPGVLKHHDLYEIVEKMQVGDSFIPKESLIFGGCFSSKFHLERKYKIKLVQRKTPEGIRVWRIA